LSHHDGGYDDGALVEYVVVPEEHPGLGLALVAGVIFVIVVVVVYLLWPSRGGYKEVPAVSL